MANISDCNIEFSGNKNSIQKLYKEIQEHTNKNWFYMDNQEPELPSNTEKIWGWSGMEIDAIEKNETSISIQASGRWHGPYSTIKYLVDKYKLDASYNDTEPGCAFYHKMEFKNGEETLDKEYDFLSKESVETYGAEYFKDNYEWIWEEDKPLENHMDLIIELIDLEVYTEDDFNEKEFELIKKGRKQKNETN